MTKASDNQFPKLLTVVQAADPSAPSNGDWTLYSKAAGIYARSSNTVVGPFAAGSNSSSTTLAVGNADITNGAADLTTTSTSFVDFTGASITITTGAHRVLLGFTCIPYLSAGDGMFFDFMVDGTRVGGNGGIQYLRFSAGGIPLPCSFTWLTSALTAASHTFKVQWRVAAGTGTIWFSTGGGPAKMYALEQSA